MTNRTIIRTINLVKKFDKSIVLKKINLDIYRGEFVSIMGASGSGKSTLLYCLGGIEHPTSGEVFVNQENMNALNDKKKSNLRSKEIGFVFQFFNLINNLTVLENVILPAVMSGGKRKEVTERAKKILKVVGLKDKMMSFPSQLSGGQQQRVAIARALINDPSIILADEPTGNLDSKSTNEIINLLVKLNKEFGTTIIQVTHDVKTTKASDRIILIEDGRVSGNK